MSVEIFQSQMEDEVRVLNGLQKGTHTFFDYNFSRHEETHRIETNSSRTTK